MRPFTWLFALLAFSSSNSLLTVVAAPILRDVSVPATTNNHFAALLKRQSLQADLNNFLSQVPNEDILKLVKDYISSGELDKRAPQNLANLGLDVEAMEQFVRDLFGGS